MSGKFALVIANTEYTDPRLIKLTAPGKDAEEFARVLRSPEIAAFDDVTVLINENATVAREAVDDFFARKKPDDLLVMYFSGHGVRDEFGSLYLAVKNSNRDRLRSTAINSSFIREGMDQSRSRRQVLILDCCNSGAFAQGTKAEIGGSVGTAMAFKGTGYGRVVLTASDSTQFAWEGDKVIGETVHSLFTHFLVIGLEGEADRDGDGNITVDELYDFAYEQIVSRTPKQTPGKWSYKQQGEIVLRQNIPIQDTKPIPLPDDLLGATNSSLPYVREGAVRQLEVLLGSRNLGLSRSARLELERIAEEDDSRRISGIAADILKRIRQEETVLAEKAREVPLTSDQVEGAEKGTKEKIAREKADRKAAEKAAQERAERAAAEKAAREKAEREAAQKAAREKAEREVAEKAAREKAERAAAEKAAREKAEREAAERTAREKAERAAAKKAARIAIWENFLQKIKTLLKTASQSLGSLKLRKKTLIITAIVSLAVVFILIGFIRLINPPLYFSGISEGEVNIYSYKNNRLTRITQALDGSVNLSPAIGFRSDIYFTSIRTTGKAEIYRFNRDTGELEQITHTPGPAESWSPALDLGGNLYFTSNRTGKAEIYGFNRNSGELMQITHTPGQWESWLPTIDLGGNLYFTSNRTGKVEIFTFNTTSGELKQITHTDGPWESWSPAVDSGSDIYFTSNRTGKAEIYRFNTNTGELERLTNTPGNAESWSPVVLGNKIYITSNQSGQSRIYLLKGGNDAITDFESWTKKFDDRTPGY